MGQFISAAAFKLRQSFSTSTDFIRIGSRVFIFDRRQWISAWAFNSLNSVTSVNKVHCVDFQCPLSNRGALCRYEATFAGVVSQLTTPMQSADVRWTDADSQWEKVHYGHKAQEMVLTSTNIRNAIHADSIRQLCLSLISKFCSPMSPSPKSRTFWLWPDLWRHWRPRGH